MAPIIEAHGLTKRFGDVRALDGLDLVAESGQVTALARTERRRQDDIRERGRHAVAS